MKKRVLALTMAAMMAVTMAGCGSKTTAETKAAETKDTAADGKETSAAETKTAETKEAETKAAGGVLVMATNAEFPPYEFREGGQIVGIDAEIAAAVAEEMGMTLQIEDMAFDSIITAVTSGKADMGVAGMTVSEDRKKSVDFSDPYAEAAQVIIVKADSAIATPDDLTGKTIGVQLGTTGDIFVDDVKDATVERYNKGFEAVQALMQGKIDAVVIDREPAKVFVEESEGLKVLDEAFTVEQYAIAVKKGNTELVTGINEAIKSLKKSGKLDEIVAKYISADSEGTAETTKAE